MPPVRLSFIISFILIAFATGLRWKVDEESLPITQSHPRRILLVTANSSLASSATSGDPSATQPPTCSGTFTHFGIPPETVYTTVTYTYTVTGLESPELKPIYITPLPPCATYNCERVKAIYGACTHTAMSTFGPPVTRVSVTKKTTVYQAPSSVVPPVFPGRSSVAKPEPQQSADLGDLASWIQSIAQVLRSSTTSPQPSQTPDSQAPKITPPPQSDADSPYPDKKVGPDGKTTFGFFGVPIIVNREHSTMIFGVPRTTLTLNDHTMPMTLVAKNQERPVTFTINPSAIVCNGTSLHLQQAQATRTEYDGRGGAAPTSDSQNSVGTMTIPRSLFILPLISIMGLYI
ncbi:hypothetical protein PRK78_002312 [Emydomyces testavorans]|uniref:Uncharacterized protein n=1 Tax=Emydomyces testavorans TaxID=2070801 RepID=A0AAF0DG46_9EURO|nr:hypothetical protein PRK78_002312 [Emydomyces testavorans]